MIIASSLVASTTSLSSSANVYSYFVDGAHESLMLAQEIHEAALLLPWKADASGPGLFGDDVKELSDLDGKVYSPPRSAKYEVITSHASWSQQVSVRTVELDNPTSVVDPNTFTGPTLTELVVTILNANQVEGTASWWMSEPADR